MGPKSEDIWPVLVLQGLDLDEIGWHRLARRSRNICRDEPRPVGSGPQTEAPLQEMVQVAPVFNRTGVDRSGHASPCRRRAQFSDHHWGSP